jgi:hypothetical protein
MKDLTPKQREVLSKTLVDVSKLIVTALVLGNFISGRPFNFILFLTGLTIFVILVIVAISIDK